MAGSEAALGSVRLRFEPGGGGIAGWALRGAAGSELDGLATEASDAAPPDPASHPNGAVRIDHIVVFTPDLARTNAALEAAGIRLRRIREPGEPGPPVRQAFFRLGEVILEVVESPQAGPGPARFWGLTMCVSDIDACAELLGSGWARSATRSSRGAASPPSGVMPASACRWL